MQGGPSTHPIRALVGTWLLLDFFGDARRSGGDASTLTTSIFSQSFLSLGISALLFPEIPPVPFAAATMCVSTLLVAIGSFDTEEPKNRRAADRLLQATSPLGRLPFVLAHALHASFSTMLVTIGMALPPAILLACHEHNAWLVPGYVALACACAALAIGALAVALRAARAALGSHRAALVAGSGKAALLAFGVALFALSLSSLSSNVDALPFPRAIAELLPPYHAAKVLHDPIGEGWRTLPWLGAAIVLLLISTALRDEENDRTQRRGRGGAIARLERRLAGAPEDAAVTGFCSTMLWRSPGIRARVLPLLGVPAAFAFLALRGSDERSARMFVAMALQFPAIYLPFVIAMMRQSDVQGSRWIFDSAPAIGAARVQRAAWISLVLRVLLPVHAMLAAMLLATTDRLLDTALLCVWSLCIGACAARVMARAIDDVPFSRDDANTNLDFGNLMAAALVLAGAGAFVASNGTTTLAVAASVAVLLFANALRSRPHDADVSDAPESTDSAVQVEHAALAVAAQTPVAQTRAKQPEPSLRRELAAIATLYVVLCALPLLIGLWLGV